MFSCKNTTHERAMQFAIGWSRTKVRGIQTQLMKLPKVQHGSKGQACCLEAPRVRDVCTNNNGVTMHGNCDLCFLKPTSQILSLISEKPSRAIWWAEMESKCQSSGMTTGDGARFRKDRPSYADMMKFSADQRSFFDPAEEGISCFCGD